MKYTMTQELLENSVTRKFMEMYFCMKHVRKDSNHNEGQR